MRQRGLTLIEVLVALVIVSIAVSMFLYFADSLRLTGLTKDETQATTIARNYFDRLHSAWQYTDDYENSISLATTQLDALPEGYKAIVKIKDESGSSILDSSEEGSVTKDTSKLRHITLTITTNKGKEMTMQTSISSPAPR